MDDSKHFLCISLFGQGGDYFQLLLLICGKRGFVSSQLSLLGELVLHFFLQLCKEFIQCFAVLMNRLRLVVFVVGEGFHAIGYYLANLLRATFCSKRISLCDYLSAMFGISSLL